MAKFDVDSNAAYLNSSISGTNELYVIEEDEEDEWQRNYVKPWRWNMRIPIAQSGNGSKSREEVEDEAFEREYLTGLDPNVRRALILPPPAAVERQDTKLPHHLVTANEIRQWATKPSTDQRTNYYLMSSTAALGTGGRLGTVGSGGMHLLRNMPTVLVANTIANRDLGRQLINLSVERHMRRQQLDCARLTFLNRLREKGGPLKQLVENIETGRIQISPTPSAVSASYSRRNSTAESASSRRQGDVQQRRKSVVARNTTKATDVVIYEPRSNSTPPVMSSSDAGNRQHEMLCDRKMTSSASSSAQQFRYDSHHWAGQRPRTSTSTVSWEGDADDMDVDSTDNAEPAVRSSSAIKRPASERQPRPRCRFASTSARSTSSSSSSLRVSQSGQLYYEPFIVVMRPTERNQMQPYLLPVGGNIPRYTMKQPASVPSADKRQSAKSFPTSATSTSYLSPQQSIAPVTSVANENSQTPMPTTARTISSLPSGATDSVIDDNIDLPNTVTRLIASVDSLHVPSVTRESSAKNRRPKRSMETILTQFDRPYSAGYSAADMQSEISSLSKNRLY